MKKLLLILLLSFSFSLVAQPKKYSCGAIITNDASPKAKSSFSIVEKDAIAVFSIDENDSTIDILFNITEKFSAHFKIKEKSPNAKVYKITDGLTEYILYVLKAKDYENSVSSKYTLVIQMESSDKTITYLCEK